MNTAITVDDVNDRRQKHMNALAVAIKACRLCAGMNIAGQTESAPGYGSVDSPVVLVGQSLCGKQCMESQIPFTGGSGSYLDRSFEEAGIAKRDVFITNVVHCHPPKNHASLPTWVSNCSPYLHLELKIVQPKLVIALGQDAKKALKQFYGKEPQKLGRPFQRPPGTTVEQSIPELLYTEHPSWLARQHDGVLDREYVTSLAQALKWAFLGVKKRSRNH